MSGVTSLVSAQRIKRRDAEKVRSGREDGGGRNRLVRDSSELSMMVEGKHKGESAIMCC